MTSVQSSPSRQLALELVECWECWMEIHCEYSKEGTARNEVELDRLVKRGVELLNNYPQTKTALTPLFSLLRPVHPAMVTIGPARQYRTPTYTEYALQLVDKLHYWVSDEVRAGEAIELKAVRENLPAVVRRLGTFSAFDTTELENGINMEMDRVGGNPYQGISPQDARDKFIYDRRTAGGTYREILEAVKIIDAWPQLNSDNAVRMAYNRFAEAHKLPREVGVSGRPAQSSNTVSGC